MKSKSIETIINSVTNCVAIAIPNEKNKPYYFSLSGTGRDYIGNCISKYSYTMNDSYLAVKELLEKRYKTVFIDCHLADYVNRYVYYYGKYVRPKHFCAYYGRLLKIPIDLITDFQINGKANNFARHYSCCEKKIAVHFKYNYNDYLSLNKNIFPNNNMNDYIFIIKKEPCRMCRPILIGCKTIKYDFL